MPFSPVARDASDYSCDVGSRSGAQLTAMITKDLFLAKDPNRIGARILHDHGPGYGLPSHRKSEAAPGRKEMGTGAVGPRQARTARTGRCPSRWTAHSFEM